MLKKIFMRVREGIEDAREQIHGEVIQDLGKVWISPNGKRAFYASVHQKGWACVVSLGYGHPQANPATWLYPVSDSIRLRGNYAELVTELTNAVELCTSGERLPPSGTSKGTTLNRAVFHRGLSNLRLVFSRRCPTGQVRIFMP